jgi:hypothetical protein
MTEQLVLDGNAIGGMLGEVFAVEFTTAGVRCAACGAVGEIGAVRAYVHAPGAVARCPECDGVLLRAVRGRDRMWLDLSGVSYLELRL